MKNKFTYIFITLLITLNLTGCGLVGEKSGSPAFIYAITAVLSLLLLIGCNILIRKKKFWFITLFSSVLVVNIGYTLLAISSNLEMALWANRISYLGSVLLPLSMAMIIMNVTNTPYKKWLPGILFGIAALIFLIAASPGILPIYYKEVSFVVVDGVSTLNKVYGPLHFLYLVYLLGYFLSMVGIIVCAHLRKRMDSSAHAVILAGAVFLNIGVWLIEQFVHFDFEMLSISYIISESFLLGVHLVIVENNRLKTVMKQVEQIQNYTEPIKEHSIPVSTIVPERIEAYLNGLQHLTPTEKEIYEAYIARVTTKEILEMRHIKESTLKYHNKNLYAKLGVASRKEILELHKYIESIKTNANDASI